MKSIQVEIRGVAPLLHNKFDANLHGENKSKAKKKMYIALEEAEKLVYRNREGIIVQPSEHIYASCVKAATSFIFEGKRSFKDIVKAGVIVEPFDMLLLDKDGNTRTTWDEIDARGVVIGRARVVKWRPLYHTGWTIKFTMTIIDDDNLSVSTLQEILTKAGTYGIGDYRPRFGRFQVTHFKELNDKNGKVSEQQKGTA
jgi:hypothetical protein